jgi:hypothetical protein
MRLRAVFLCSCLILSGLILLPIEVSRAGNGEEYIVINEIMYDPFGTEVDGEWVELYNNGTKSVDMGNWSLADQESPNNPSDIDFVFPEDFEVPPGAYVVVHTGGGADDTDFSDNVAHLYMGKTSDIWSNSGDDVLLKNETDYGIDFVAYTDASSVDSPPSELAWIGPNASANEGNSISLHPNGVDIDSGLSWEESDPTPGRANAHLYDDPPEILEIRIFMTILQRYWK